MARKRAATQQWKVLAIALVGVAMLRPTDLLGHEDVRNYDGSWTEWASRPETPKATA